MPIQKLDQWAETRAAQSFPLPTLKDAVIGIDASYYLNLRLNANPKEDPLKHATGGVPFSLKAAVRGDIACLNAVDAKVVFVFDGLDHANKPPSDSFSQDSAKAADNAWQKYRSGDGNAVSAEFLKVKYPYDHLYRWLQELLVKWEVEFLVAPYSAVAQLSYMVNLSEQYIDCIWGSTEYFLFGIDKVMTNITDAEKIEEASFTWINKSLCEERLKVTSDALRDAQLLLGTSFSPVFPPLARQGLTPKGASITDAVNMLNGQNRSVLQLCHVWRDDPAMAASNYVDSYKKALMSIRHHIAIEHTGAVGPFNAEHAPSDVHDFVGQNLPHEIFFYLSRGLIGPELLNWLSHDNVEVQLQPGVVDSYNHRALIFEQLNPIRAKALKTMSEVMNNYYRFRKVPLVTWDADRERDDLTINIRELDSVHDEVSHWKVKDALMKGTGEPFTLLKCLQALKDSDFRQQTLNGGKTTHAYPTFISTNEVVVNTYYRFLQAREYVNSKHELTKWGRVLEAVLQKLGSASRADDTAILTVELMRFGLLDGGEPDGTSADPSEKDSPERSYVNLVSKIACLGRLAHSSVGFAGPLDRRLLSFAWKVTAVRRTLRILMEAILVSMFLRGEVQRDRDDWMKISKRLPLSSDQGCALGLVAKTYFDQLRDSEQISDALKEEIKSGRAPYHWFRHAKGEGLAKSLDVVHTMWDAAQAGADESGENEKKKLFHDADTWFNGKW